MYRNARYMCIILVANITWRSGHAIRSSFLLDFSAFSTIVADVSSQFSTSQLIYMIVLATRIIYGDPTVNAQKSGQGELARRLDRLFLILNTAINQKNSKKISCHKHFKQALSLFRSLDRASR